MIAPLLVLFVGLLVLPVVFVASIGRGGPILWVGGAVLVAWAIETLVDLVIERRDRRRREGGRCVECGPDLLPVQDRCPECDMPRRTAAALPPPRPSRTIRWLEPAYSTRDTFR